MVSLSKFFDARAGRAISFATYGEPLRLDTRTKGENSCQDQSGYNCPSPTYMFRMRALELGLGRWFYERSRAYECLDGRKKVWFSLRRLRLLDLREHSVFQPSSVGAWVGYWAGHGKVTQGMGSLVRAWQTKPHSTPALMFLMLTSLCLGDLRTTS
jgi:hypothetical protein